MDDSSIIRLRDLAREHIRKTGIRAEPAEDSEVVGFVEGKTKWKWLAGSFRLRSVIFIWVLGLLTVSNAGWLSVFFGRRRASGRALFDEAGVMALGVSVIGVAVAIQVLVPKILKLFYLCSDIDGFAEDLPRGVMRTFDAPKTRALDDAVFAARNAVGYDVVRDEDVVDTMAIIESIVVPRILSSALSNSVVPTYASAASQNSCADLIADNVALLKSATATEAEKTTAADVLNQYWADACAPGMFAACAAEGAGGDAYDAMNCASNSDIGGKYEGFFHKPDGVYHALKSKVECFAECNSEECEAAVFDDGKCYTVEAGTSDISWKFDVNSEGGTLFNRNKVGFEYTVENVVSDIVAAIQALGPVVDFEGTQDVIRDRLSTLDPEYATHQEKYDEAIALLMSRTQALIAGADGEPDEEIANATDRIVFNEYLAETSVEKFNLEIAWPLLASAASILSRNDVLDKFADREQSNRKPWVIICYTALAAGGVAALVVALKNHAVISEFVARHAYPAIPLCAIAAVAVVSLITIMIKQERRHNHNIGKRVENTRELAKTLRDFATFVLSSGHSLASAKVQSGEVIHVGDSLAIAVIDDDVAGVSYHHGTGTAALGTHYTPERREELLLKLANVVTAYDTCHNMAYRGGVPFPWEVLLIYLVLLIVGVAALFKIPSITPARAMQEVELAASLGALAQDPAEAESHGEYVRMLCELWQAAHSDSRAFGRVMRSLSVYLSVIFGNFYIVRVAEDTDAYSRRLASGILGVQGSC